MYTDLHDYANEDGPTAEEEEQMEELLPVVKAQLEEYTGFNDGDVLDYLWDNYLEVDATVAEMKKKFKKKGEWVVYRFYFVI